jgi:GrpB-like predicted nucleotidyltransferase (UPF0157 family)
MVDIEEEAAEVVPSRYGEWEKRFKVEGDRLRRTLRDRGLDDRVVRPEHVGSTAVPGLPAKDVVDPDVVAADGSVDEVAAAVVDGLDGTRYENSGTWNLVARRNGGTAVRRPRLRRLGRQVEDQRRHPGRTPRPARPTRGVRGVEAGAGGLD